MPVATSHHCFAKLTESWVMLIGGTNNLRSNQIHSCQDYNPNLLLLADTYFYDFNVVDIWTPGPMLLQDRDAHTCGAIVDSVDCTQIVVVASGYYYITTEIWIVGSEAGFMFGPDMPFHTVRTKSVVGFDGTALIVVAGNDANTGHSPMTKIQKFWCENLDCQWIVMEQELAVARYGPAVMLVPDSLVTCA